jgi:hypothetical protein
MNFHKHGDQVLSSFTVLKDDRTDFDCETSEGIYYEQHYITWDRNMPD